MSSSDTDYDIRPIGYPRVGGEFHKRGRGVQRVHVPVSMKLGAIFLCAAGREIEDENMKL